MNQDKTIELQTELLDRHESNEDEFRSASSFFSDSQGSAAMHKKDFNDVVEQANKSKKFFSEQLVNEDLLEYQSVFTHLTESQEFDLGKGMAVVDVCIMNDSTSVVVIIYNEALSMQDDSHDEYFVRSISLLSQEIQWELPLQGAYMKISEIK